MATISTQMCGQGGPTIKWFMVYNANNPPANMYMSREINGTY
jgi:hypothetical protein